MATKKRASKRASAKKSRPKKSLVENINRRRRAGKSRPKSRSTVSEQAYREMEEGWPKRKRVQKTHLIHQGLHVQ